MTPPLPAAPLIPKTSSQAVWSLVLGILSITCLWLLGSIPAILLGRAAFKKIDESGGTLTGRGLAMAGIITGSVGILLGFITVGSILAAAALPAFNQVQNQAKQTRQTNQIKQIIVACHYHATEENGAFPESLEALVEAGYLGTEDPHAIDTIGGIFLYRPGLTGTSPDEEIFVASPVPIDRHRVVGRVGGQITLVPEEDFQADYAHLFPHQ
ncbi:MAG: DUF4190 domain-containing protein [Verrucomicrobiales bacterium]|nr:DUF4190 domain-containing protein [Verrucomicrobiales bacterium]